MKQVVVTGTFVVSWNVDEALEEWEMADDSAVLQECISSVEDEFAFYAVNADVREVQGSIVG